MAHADHMTTREAAEYLDKQAGKGWPGSSGIHGFYRGAKANNTCAPASKKRWIRAVAGMTAHLAKHPNDAACKTRLSNAKARAA